MSLLPCLNAVAGRPLSIRNQTMPLANSCPAEARRVSHLGASVWPAVSTPEANVCLRKEPLGGRRGERVEAGYSRETADARCRPGDNARACRGPHVRQLCVLRGPCVFATVTACRSALERVPWPRATCLSAHFRRTQDARAAALPVPLSSTCWSVDALVQDLHIAVYYPARYHRLAPYRALSRSGHPIDLHELIEKSKRPPSEPPVAAVSSGASGARFAGGLQAGKCKRVGNVIVLRLTGAHHAPAARSEAAGVDGTQHAPSWRAARGGLWRAAAG
jgi:hypothetical protein